MCHYWGEWAKENWATAYTVHSLMWIEMAVCVCFMGHCLRAYKCTYMHKYTRAHTLMHTQLPNRYIYIHSHGIYSTLSTTHIPQWPEHANRNHSWHFWVNSHYSPGIWAALAHYMAHGCTLLPCAHACAHACMCLCGCELGSLSHQSLLMSHTFRTW